MARGKAASQYSESLKKGKKKKRKIEMGSGSGTYFIYNVTWPLHARKEFDTCKTYKKSSECGQGFFFFFFNYFIGNTCYNFWVRLTFH